MDVIRSYNGPSLNRIGTVTMVSEPINLSQRVKNIEISMGSLQDQVIDLQLQGDEILSWLRRRVEGDSRNKEEASYASTPRSPTINFPKLSLMGDEAKAPFTDSIHHAPTNHILYSNRSAVTNFPNSISPSKPPPPSPPITATPRSDRFPPPTPLFNTRSSKSNIPNPRETSSSNSLPPSSRATTSPPSSAMPSPTAPPSTNSYPMLTPSCPPLPEMSPTSKPTAIANAVAPSLLLGSFSSIPSVFGSSSSPKFRTSPRVRRNLQENHEVDSPNFNPIFSSSNCSPGIRPNAIDRYLKLLVRLCHIYDPGGGAATSKGDELQLVRSNTRRSIPSQADEEAHQWLYLQKHMANILSLLVDSVEGMGEESLVLTLEKFSHLEFLIQFEDKGREGLPLNQAAPFFANSDPDMPAVLVLATQVHDWILKNMATSFAAKETVTLGFSDLDVNMTDAYASSNTMAPVAPGRSSVHNNTSYSRSQNLVEGVSKACAVKHASDIKGHSAKVLNCHDSMIYILAPLRYATVYGCSDATVVLGAIGMVVRVEHCERVQIITAAKHICIANCRDCVFFLGVNDQPLFLGDSHKIQVAPYDPCYCQLVENMSQVGVDPTVNKWNEPLVSGLIDPHDSLSHLAGVSDIQRPREMRLWESKPTNVLAVLGGVASQELKVVCIEAGMFALRKKKKISNGFSISQEAFDSLVKENMEDLDMDADEALQDAIQTLTLQGVDLSGIVKCIPGVNGVKDNPLIQTLGKLSIALNRTSNTEEMIELLKKLYDLCSAEGSENASIATRNGGLELLISIVSKFKSEKPLTSALKTLSSIIPNVQSTETFRQSGGPKVIVDILINKEQSSDVLDGVFTVIAAASTGNEVVKELFMDLKVDELILQIMREQNKCTPDSLYDAIRVLLKPDDNRVLASQVFGYARRFAKLGIANAIVDALKGGKLSSSSLVSACIALRAVVVNDEICSSVSGNGGIGSIFQFIDGGGEYNNKVSAKACCSLLSKLAGSDDNKTAIVQKGGLDRLIKLSSRFSDDPSVLLEIMSIIGVLSLRSPENAARAVEAGAGDLAIQSMQKFPAASQMQRQSCLMIRNLVARNVENRTILLSNDIEKLIRKTYGRVFGYVFGRGLLVWKKIITLTLRTRSI